ncbi:MAG: hypothetical protein QOG13_1278 [Sphingomonadales bacterium]|jgi:hypothetical protein|nr:hypothetical protein [Sphingomonadales bacterium]
MSGRLSGTIVGMGESRRSRGETKYDFIAIRDERGREHRLKGVSVADTVDRALAFDRPAIFYHSKFWGYLYGVRVAGEKGRFESWATRWYAPWMALGMIFGGLATAMFLFPIPVAIIGICALIVSIDARFARAQFRRDEKRAAALP